MKYISVGILCILNLLTKFSGSLSISISIISMSLNKGSFVGKGIYDIEVFEIRLTGKYLPDLESSIQEISLNSQMGKALYLKNIHNKITYKIHGEEVEIKVLEKNGNIVN